MKYRTLVVEIKNGVGIVWMNRPKLHNALDAVMIAELSAAMRALEDDPAVHALVLAGTGASFCGGIDMQWLQDTAARTARRNHADVMLLATMMHGIHTLKKPTVARVHGPAFACGVGLVAACDFAVAAYEAEFCLSEVRFGLIPATIGPYLVRAMGERAARRYLLSAEPFTAAEAYRIGLVTDIAPPGELDGQINDLLGHLLQGAPGAQALTKDWVRAAADAPMTPGLIDDGVKRFTAVCASQESREGMRSFLEKRTPAWLAEAKKSVRKKRGTAKGGRKK